MSLCIRTISNKLTSLVGTRTAATRINRQLPKHIEKTSTFFEEFLSGGTYAKSDGREPALTSNLVAKPLKTTSDNIVAWNYKLRSDRNWSIVQSKRDCIKDITNNLSKDYTVYSSSRVVLSVREKDATVRHDSQSGEQANAVSENPLGKPSQEQLNQVYEVLRADLPNFFIKSINYTIYHHDIVFENNIKGTVTRGMYEYVKQTAMLRIIGHLKFAYIKFDVLKITIHPEDNSVKVRWRIRGLTGTKVILKFWKFKLWNLQEAIDQLESWYDGFSTFYIDGSGKVVKHVADKMMPDQDNEVTKDKTGMAAKLALFLGLLMPREFLMEVASPVSISIDHEDEDSTKTVDTSSFLIKNSEFEREQKNHQKQGKSSMSLQQPQRNSSFQTEM